MSAFRAMTLKTSRRALEDLDHSIVQSEPQLSALIRSVKKEGKEPRRVTVLSAIEKSSTNLRRAIADILPRLDLVIETTLRNEVRSGPGVPVDKLGKYQESIDVLTSAIAELSKHVGRLVELNRRSR